MNERKEIKRAVFAAYDAAIERSCSSFAKIFHQILSAIYNNPNNFLAKQILKDNQQDDEAEFSRYVLAYIAGQTEENKLQKRSRRILLKLNPACGLNISKTLIIDPKNKPKNKEGTGTFGGGSRLVIVLLHAQFHDWRLNTTRTFLSYYNRFIMFLQLPNDPQKVITVSSAVTPPSVRNTLTTYVFLRLISRWSYQGDG